MEQKKEFDGRLLLVTTLLISICSIIYELMISSVSTYLNGDSIKQYSITIGLYMSAMGVGSYLSKKVKTHLFRNFIFVEICTGILGGLSSLALFLANIYTENYALIMYLFIIAIGILVGLEIPLLTRIIEENDSNIRVNLANIFTFDYIGGLLGSLAFPLLLFPKLGFVTTAFLVGCINIVASFLICQKYRGYIENGKVIRSIIVATFVILFSLLLFGGKVTKEIEQGLYRDDVIYSRQTMYQKIVMTKHKDDLRLFLDGNIQFSSKDEYRYHEALVHIPFSYAKNHERILILGGGDGLAAREVLKYQDVKEVILVDIDEEMTTLCSTEPLITELNESALTDERMTVLNEDGYSYVENNTEKFDVVIVDFPDPNNESLNKLYTDVFYNYIAANVNEGGVVVVQSTSPYYASNSFWCIHKTIATQFETVLPYHVQVPAFGDWGFNLAYQGERKPQPITVETKFLNAENVESAFVFAKDEKRDLDTLEENRMFEPALVTYYNQDVENW